MNRLYRPKVQTPPIPQARPAPERRTVLHTALAAGAVAALSATTGCGANGDGGASATGLPKSPAPTPARPASPRPGPSSADWPALGSSLDGLLVRPGDAAYASARQLYNTRFDTLKPAAVAYVRHEDDVRECLAFARKAGTPVAIRSGGHSYAGWSSGNGRLVVDVSSLARVEADGTVGAGAKLIDVYRGLARHGRTVPGGSCPTVGISGLTLGGGHGVTSRAYGLTCDNLTSATLVTADGTTLTADDTHHTDLFWALRGAGNGNFGVVTELRFRTRPAPPTVSGFLSYPWSRAQAVLAAWQAWGPEQPDEIWSSVHLDAGPGGGTPTLSIAAFSLGTYGDLQNAVDRLADRIGASASSVSLRRQSLLEAMLVYAGCSGLTEEQCHLPGTTPGRSEGGALRRESYAAASDFFDKPLSAAGLRVLIDRAEAFTRIPADQGGGEGSIALTALGGAVNRIDPRATAFVHRRSRVLAQYIGAWQPGTSGTSQQGWLKTTHAELRRYASGAAYQNYADPRLTDWRQAYYGPAAERLARLKQQYDPTRLFTYPQSL
ncbi:FAD-binding oxidoreductase [Streptomyces sp. NBC_00234]|uniref:FAD-binding oxidoreductase n=1 Tax=Streptomyces sp. NBC_00234 TaxID=2903638 RepID=UPI002E2AB7FB|nr:FAD-binding oxidoreductase [Streptomyces sp. NBC_00234]